MRAISPKAGAKLPDLDQCAREPIHIPGSIQPPGVLLSIDPDGETILQASANAPDLLGVPMERLLGARWTDLVAFDDTDWRQDTTRPWHTPWLPVRLPASHHAAWYGALHLYADRWLLELAPLATQFDEDPLRQGYQLGRRLAHDATVEAAAQRTAGLVRNVLGYDRVMVYRFDPEWNGEVVGEAVRHGLEPYLGLHYPHTDIPAQARALYLRNRVRTIGDILYTPCPMVPPDDPRSGAPLDMSDIALRSVSPVHVEYLSNMGVSATLVASIIVNSRLWGLIACHHYDLLYADHQMRELADAVASALAARVGALEEIAEVEQEGNLLTAREKLITAFNESEHVSPELLASLAPLLLEVVDADGVAVFSDEQVRGYGHLPDQSALQLIRDVVGAAHDDQDTITGVLHTDAIGARFPTLADVASLASGIIFMPLTADAHNAILWTRREMVHEVRWGGNPYLSKLQKIPGARLSPRQSFDLWQETVRGRSRPWASVHLESARSLRVLIELIERKHYQRNIALLRASLARLPQAMLIVQAAVHWTDTSVVYCNAAFARAMNIDERAVEGLPMTSLLLDTGSDADALDALDAALQRREALQSVLTLRRADGSGWRCRLRAEPVRDDAQRVTHWLVTELDT